LAKCKIEKCFDMDEKEITYKSLSNEFVISNLIDNIKKTDSTVTKLSLLLVVIIIGYLLVDFNVADNITIGIISLKGNHIVKMITPILFGFTFFKTYNASMFLRELRVELKQKLQNDYGIEKEKIKLYSTFDFDEYISSFKNYSNIGSLYLILLVLVYIVVSLFPLAFQLYTISNLFSIEFKPNIILLASKIISITLMAIAYGNLFARLTDIFIETFKEDEYKLDYPKFTLTVFQTIISLLFAIGFYFYGKTFFDDIDISNFHKQVLLVLFIATVLMSYYAFFNSIRSFKENFGKVFKGINIGLLIYNSIILLIFIYIIIK